MNEYIIKHVVRGEVEYETVNADSTQEAYDQIRDNYDGDIYVIFIAKIMKDWKKK